MPTTNVPVFTQAPDPSGGMVKSAWYAPDGLDGDSYAFDNFTLTSSQAIKEIDWRGGYTNFLSGAGEAPVSDFTIKIYASIPAGTQPDLGYLYAGPLANYTVGGNAGETPAGTFGGVPMYDYHFVLPNAFQATGGVKYWVQIEATQGLTPFYSWPPDWSIAYGSGGDNSHFQAITGGTNGGGTLYYSTAHDLAFSLLAAGSPATSTVSVLNVTAPVGAMEGTSVGGTLAVFNGSTVNINDYAATVNWGDGATSVLTAANGGIIDNGDGTYSVIANNTYAEEGSYNLSVSVSNGVVSDVLSATLVVNDAPLAANPLAMTTATPNVPLGANPVTIATFTDFNPAAQADDFTATINWGDGTSDTVSGASGGIVAVAGQPGQWAVLGNHTYSAVGNYNVTVDLQDVGGALATAAGTIFVGTPSTLQITPYDPATSLSTLTNALVAPGSGLTIVGSSFVGGNGQAGTYTGFSLQDPNSSLSLANGILLTSGSAINALGPNTVPDATTAWATGSPFTTPAGDPLGDSNLNSLIVSTDPYDITYDANSLTLQFVVAPGVTTVQFKFVYGTEEFPEWVGQFNDVFGAFLDGTQISYDPAGNPITVNNNYFQLNNSGDTTNPYTAGKTVVTYDIQYDGLTPVLTTQATLDPNIAVHTLKFAIADTRDQILDSGVFLSSLSGNNIVVGGGTSGGTGGGTGGGGGSTGGNVTGEAPEAEIDGPYQVAVGGTVTLSAAGTTDPDQAANTLSYNWDFNGNGIYGETGAAATNGDEVGIHPTFNAAGLPGGSAVTVSLHVTDTTGLTSAASTVIHVAKAVPTFNGLSAPTITFGTGTALIQGHLSGNAGGQAVPAGEIVNVTLNGVTLNAVLDGSDNFAAAFATSSLPATSSPYAIAFSYAGDAAFESASGQSVLTVKMATPTLTWAAPDAITYGTALTSAQLNAVAVDPTSLQPLSGTFSYSPSAGTVLSAGAQTLQVTFTPTDAADYQSVSASVTFNVNRATPTFSGLSAPTINVGASSTTISGHLNGNAGAQAIPAGEIVKVTLNGVTQNAVVDSGNNFTTTFATGSLTASSSPYAIKFSYAGDANFNSASASSTLTVNKVVAPKVTLNPTSQTVITGKSVTFTAAATGTPAPTVQWQVSTNGGSTYTNIPGATAASLTFTTNSAQNGYRYRAVFTNSAGTATTASATLTVQWAPVVTVNPVDQKVAAGKTVTFQAAANSNPAATVQWQVSTDGGKSFTNITGATKTSLSFTAKLSQNGYRYRAVFINSIGTAFTTAATLTV